MRKTGGASIGISASARNGSDRVAGDGTSSVRVWSGEGDGGTGVASGRGADVGGVWISG